MTIRELAVLISQRQLYMSPTMKCKVDESWGIIQEAYDIKPSDLVKLQVIALMFGLEDKKSDG